LQFAGSETFAYSLFKLELEEMNKLELEEMNKLVFTAT
jgi:hypothetical protein